MKKIHKKIVILGIFLALCLAAQQGLLSVKKAWAAGEPNKIAQRLNYQGRLTDSANLPRTATVPMIFRIYDASSAGNLLWGPETQGSVGVVNGVFNVQIGSVLTLPSTIFAQDALFLEATIDGELMSPRQRLLASPYAFNTSLLAGKTTDYFLSTAAVNQSLLGDKYFMGNMGIGTTTPVSRLHVFNSAGTQGPVLTISTGSTKLFEVNAASVCADNDLFIKSSRSLYLKTTDVTHGLRYAYTDWVSGDAVDGPVLFGYAGGRLGFIAGGNTTALSWTNSGYGRVGIGTANPRTTFEVAGRAKIQGIASDPSAVLEMHALDGAATSYLFLDVLNNLNYESNAGITRMLLTNGGNLGIGTASPLARLHVSSAPGVSAGPLLIVSTGTTKLLEVNSSSVVVSVPIVNKNPGGGMIIQGSTQPSPVQNGTLTIENSTAATINLFRDQYYDAPAINDRIGEISMSLLVPTKLAGIASFQEAGTTFNNADLRFYTTENFIKVYYERMRITKLGFVGIGTQSPAELLHVASAGDAGIVIDGAAASQSRLAFRAGGTEKAVFYRPQSSNDVRLYGDSFPGDIMTWGTTSGNVGVGTTDPVAKLQLFAAGGVVDKGPLFIVSTGTTKLFEVNASSTIVNSDLIVPGRAGIGTTSVPASLVNLGLRGRLEIGGIVGDADAVMHLKTYSGVTSYLYLDNTANDLHYELPAGVSRFHVTSLGQMGIGTTTPLARLHVSSGAGVSNGPLLIVSTGSTRVFEVNSTSAIVRSSMTVIDGFSAARIGVGTTYPTYRFHFKAGTDKNLFFEDAFSMVGAVQVSAINDANSAGIPIELRSSLLSIASNVGIGTGTVTNALDVCNNGIIAVHGTNPRLVMEPIDADTSRRNMDVFGTGSSAIWRFYKESRGTGTDGTLNYMGIDSIGNVGIGTVNPISKLHAFSSAGTGNPVLTVSTGTTKLFEVSGTSITTGVGIIVGCPAGFTSVEAKGRQLGCIQTDENGSALYLAAANTCFTSYGGRLPTMVEWFIATNNYNLNSETGNYEWVSDYIGWESPDFLAGVVGNSSISDVEDLPISTSLAYRCWISK